MPDTFERLDDVVAVERFTAQALQEAQLQNALFELRVHFKSFSFAKNYRLQQQHIQRRNANDMVATRAEQKTALRRGDNRKGPERTPPCCLL